jgi:cobaltochelatase CobN
MGTAAWRLTLAVFLLTRLLLPTRPSEAGCDAVLLVGDMDSYLADAATSGLELPDGFRARAFCLSDLKGNNEAGTFIRDSSVIVVDVMTGGLPNYLIDNGLTDGRSLFAVSSSANVSALKEKGFIFDETIRDYYRHNDVSNLRNMMKRAISLSTGARLDYDPVKVKPRNGLYHPEAKKNGGNVFEDVEEFLKWSEARTGYNAQLPRLGLMFFASLIVEGKKEALDALIRKLEKGGFNLLPVFGNATHVVKSYFLDGGRPRVDAILSFSFHGADADELKESLEKMDVPIFNAISLYSQTIAEWEASQDGIPPFHRVWTMAIPEMSGAMEPTPLQGKVEARLKSGALAYRFELIPGMTERMIPRMLNWVKLRRARNSEKKVALFYYNNSRGKQNIRASYLNVFRSIKAILDDMRKSGYLISEDVDEDTIKGLVLRGGRNVGSWAPGELDALIESGQAYQLPIEEYKRWFVELPGDFRKRVIDQWGEPEKSDLMVKNGKIIIPMIKAGNVVLLPEPARGAVDDPIKLYHDPVLYPHHQYIAAYLWLDRVFGADAMVHLGTHATYEWLPGKSADLSAFCPPDVMVTDIPNIYPYTMDDVSEALQAKRRGRAVIVDHLTPPLTEAEGYHEYIELKEVCAQYEAAASQGGATAETYLERVRETALKLGLDKDLGLDGVKTAEDVGAISEYLEYLETSDVPYGLHTFGRSPGKDALSSTVKAILKQNPSLPTEDLSSKLRESGKSESDSLLGALEGRYVSPTEGNDPVRNPGAIPTGKNVYGLSPRRLPTPAAWELGQKTAAEIIKKYAEEHDGVYPEKVAMVLWSVETLRNEGVNEATILSLVGVKPVWNPNGEVAGTRPIRGRDLGEAQGGRRHQRLRPVPRPVPRQNSVSRRGDPAGGGPGRH